MLLGRLTISVQATPRMCFHTVSSLAAFMDAPEINSTIDTSTQFQNKASNALLQQFINSRRMRGHKAACIDPLDLIHREVAALNPN